MLNTNKLKGALASAGYTQKSCAQKIGISENTFSSKINGHSKFTIDEVDELCTVLGILDGAKKAEIFLATPSQ